jgi:dipeptidyl aminopeptidase/acylaminoacyl peptidase
MDKPNSRNRSRAGESTHDEPIVAQGLRKRVSAVPSAAGLLAAALVLAPSALAQSSPRERQATDPQSIASLSNADARALPLEDLYGTRFVGGAAWSPNGREIVFETTFTGRSNLWKIAARGGWPIQLAPSEDRQTAAAWSPDGRWIVYQQDQAGDEMWDLYAVPSTGGVPENLTHTPEVREESPHWSPDGSQIALNYKMRTGRSYDLALMDWKTREVGLLTHEAAPEYSWNVVAWSPDGKTLYANRVEVTYTDADVYAVDVASLKARNLTPHEGKVLFTASQISPDGRTLLVDSNQKHGYTNVALLDVASGQLKWLTDTEWEASSADFSPDGRSVVYSVNADGQVGLFSTDIATGETEPLTFPNGANGFSGNPHAYSPQGARILLFHQSSTQPGDLWVYDVATKSARQLTFSAVASLSATPLPAAQIVHYQSFDGTIISALLWMPFNLKRDGSNPLLVLPHGGPTGQVVDYWSPRVAAFISRGYICIAPNVRGSTGYGIDFQKANYQDLGGGDLQDEIYAVKLAEATGYVDPKRIGITGGSYGGFMTLMAVGKAPEVWRAAVELFGIIDWRTMLEHTDPELQEYIKGLLGDPTKDAAAYDNASPIKYLHAVRAPLLVLQGEKDPRVPKEEADQVVNTLRKDGRTVDVHYYPNEGHGFAKRENQIDSVKRTLDWFEKYLK